MWRLQRCLSWYQNNINDISEQCDISCQGVTTWKLCRPTGNYTTKFMLFPYAQTFPWSYGHWSEYISIYMQLFKFVRNSCKISAKYDLKFSFVCFSVDWLDCLFVFCLFVCFVLFCFLFFLGGWGFGGFCLLFRLFVCFLFVLFDFFFLCVCVWGGYHKFQ